MVLESVARILGGRPLPQTGPDDTVRDACAALDAMNVGALAVLDGDRLVGILSERDVIRKCICQGRRTAETRVREIMTPDPKVIAIGESLAAALRLMIEGGFRHVPVLDGSRVAGLLSMRDIPTEYRLMLERYTEYRDGRIPA